MSAFAPFFAAAALACVAQPAPAPTGLSPRIDNAYLPMKPGARWVYRETDGRGAAQKVVVTVTRRTKRIAGVTARVVHDRVTERGRLVEDTFDWLAQDRLGNVWYLGEETTEFERGEPVSTAGSWQAGVDGARAGIVMLAQPRVGACYRQEDAPGQAEDQARVQSLDEQVRTPAGRFENALETRDVNPLEPIVNEHKYYARGVGLVLAVALSGGAGREELVSFHTP